MAVGFSTYVVEACYDDRAYALRVPTLPGCFSQAEFPDEIEPMIRDAISIHQDVHLMDFEIEVKFVATFD